jgi:hypothetical protein
VVTVVTVVNGYSHVMRNIFDDSTYIVDSVALTCEIIGFRLRVSEQEGTLLSWSSGPPPGTTSRATHRKPRT